MKSAVSENKRVLYLLIMGAMLQLLLLYFFKYQNQNLSVFDIDLEITGNLYNLVVYLTLIFLFIGSLISKKVNINLKLTTSLMVLSYLFLVSGFISTKVNLPFNAIYIFGQFGNKLFTGLCYTIYQLLIFTSVFVLIFAFRKGQGKIFIKSLLLSLALMVTFLFYSYFFISAREEKVKLQPLDTNATYTVVVLGAAVWSDNKPSPILAARVDKAFDLLKTYKVEYLYLTGSNAPGELSEAEVALRYLKSKGIPANTNIITENNTTSTTEQIQFIKAKLSEYSKNNLIVVSDAFHLVRIKEIGKFHSLKVKTIASELELNFISDLYNKLRESLALTVFWFFAI